MEEFQPGTYLKPSADIKRPKSTRFKSLFVTLHKKETLRFRDGLTDGRQKRSNGFAPGREDRQRKRGSGPNNG